MGDLTYRCGAKARRRIRTHELWIVVYGWASTIASLSSTELVVAAECYLQWATAAVRCIRRIIARDLFPLRELGALSSDVSQKCGPVA